MKNIILFLLTEIFLLAQVVLCVAAVIFAPIYTYFYGGLDALGFLFLLVFWLVFCLGLIFKQ